jgi:hypothetical protein
VISLSLALVLAGGAFVLGGWLGLTYAKGLPRRVCERLLPDVDPYLRRMAAVAGLELTHPTFNARSSADEICDHLALLARRLLDRERRGQHPGTSDTLGLAETQPVAAKD